MAGFFFALTCPTGHFLESFFSLPRRELRHEERFLWLLPRKGRAESRMVEAAFRSGFSRFGGEKLREKVWHAMWPFRNLLSAKDMW